jgi:hypothetical protein
VKIDPVENGQGRRDVGLKQAKYELQSRGVRQSKVLTFQPLPQGRNGRRAARCSQV